MCTHDCVGIDHSFLECSLHEQVHDFFFYHGQTSLLFLLLLPPPPPLPPTLLPTELVWKVARYTSAAPMYFTEMDHYVDGGVMANNPCDYGLARIQHHFFLRQQRLPIALVVSIGTGVYPTEFGVMDLPSCLSPGRQWLTRPSLALQRVRNFVTLVKHAVSGGRAPSFQ